MLFSPQELSLLELPHGQRDAVRAQRQRARKMLHKRARRLHMRKTFAAKSISLLHASHRILRAPLAILFLVLLLTSCEITGRATKPDDLCKAWAPIYISSHDSLTDGTRSQVLAHDETGHRLCGWPYAKPKPAVPAAKVVPAKP